MATQWRQRIIIQNRPGLFYARHIVTSAFMLLLMHNTTLRAQTGYNPTIVSQYELLTHLIATDRDAAAIAHKLAASSVDEEGLVGSNSRDGRNSNYPDFLAEEQRGAFSNFMEGILLNDDKNLYIGWQALMSTYNHQQLAGDFGPPPETAVAPLACASSWLPRIRLLYFYSKALQQTSVRQTRSSRMLSFCRGPVAVTTVYCPRSWLQWITWLRTPRITSKTLCIQTLAAQTAP